MLTPLGVFSASLLLSLALWLPSALASLRGQLGLPAAGLRYLVAFVLCRFALGAVTRLVINYELAAQAREAAADAEARAQPETPQRRRDDLAA